MVLPLDCLVKQHVHNLNAVIVDINGKMVLLFLAVKYSTIPSIGRVKEAPKCKATPTLYECVGNTYLTQTELYKE